MPLALALAALQAGGQTTETGNRSVEYFEYESYTQLADLARSLDYTPESWMAGIREVPRVFLTDVPPRWRDSVSNGVSVTTKKRLFFRIGAPLVLRSNELIMRDRSRVESQRALLGSDTDFTSWITALALR